MAKQYRLYKCEVCGNVVQDLVPGAGDLICCDQAMTELAEKTADSATEKHVPVITKVDGGYDVVVGSTLHPMTDEHYIMWIELQLDNLVLRQYLNPGDEPKAHFDFSGSADQIWAREYCNIHGQWKGGM